MVQTITAVELRENLGEIIKEVARSGEARDVTFRGEVLVELKPKVNTAIPKRNSKGETLDQVLDRIHAKNTYDHSSDPFWVEYDQATPQRQKEMIREEHAKKYTKKKRVSVERIINAIKNTQEGEAKKDK